MASLNEVSQCVKKVGTRYGLKSTTYVRSCGNYSSRGNILLVMLVGHIDKRTRAHFIIEFRARRSKFSKNRARAKVGHQNPHNGALQRKNTLMIHILKISVTWALCAACSRSFFILLSIPFSLDSLTAALIILHCISYSNSSRDTCWMRLIKRNLHTMVRKLHMPRNFGDAVHIIPYNL